MDPDKNHMKRNSRVTIFSPDFSTDCSLPIFSSSVSAGFPSPADDYIEGQLDLNKHLIKHPSATFFVRVDGDSMIDAGIHPGDILIVDRSLEPSHKKVVIAIVDGDFTVKRLYKENGLSWLAAENKRYAPITSDDTGECQIWGVVTNVIHPL